MQQLLSLPRTKSTKRGAPADKSFWITVPLVKDKDSVDALKELRLEVWDDDLFSDSCMGCVVLDAAELLDAEKVVRTPVRRYELKGLEGLMEDEDAMDEDEKDEVRGARGISSLARARTPMLLVCSTNHPFPHALALGPSGPLSSSHSRSHSRSHSKYRFLSLVSIRSAASGTDR